MSPLNDKASPRDLSLRITDFAPITLVKGYQTLVFPEDQLTKDCNNSVCKSISNPFHSNRKIAISNKKTSRSFG